MKDWIPDEFALNLVTVPYHPAAVDFYREKGLWSEELERHQEQLMELK
jgi:hypothetical protein